MFVSWKSGVVLAAFALFTGPAKPATVPAKLNAVWVNSVSSLPNPVTDAPTRVALIQDSSASGINMLYVAVYSSTPNSAGRYLYEYSDIAALVQAAHAQGILVYTASGDPDWPTLGCSASANPMLRIADIVAYNAANPSAMLDGVMLDVEPGGTPDYVALLDLYQCSQQQAQANGLGLSVAISAFWTDIVTFGQVTEAAYEQIVDLKLTNIVVMGYRNYAGTSNCAAGDGLVCLDQAVIAYANSVSQANTVLVGLDTDNPTTDDVPAEETFYSMGQTAMNAAAQSVISQFSAINQTFSGFAVNNYLDSYLSGTISGWPATNPNSPLSVPVFSLMPASASLSSAGGTGTVTVTTTPSDSSWTASSGVSWIAITSGASGTGNGTVVYSVTANNSVSGRSGALTIAGQTFTVMQSGAMPSFTLTPPSANIAAAGGAETVSLTATPPDAPWTIATPPSWITITSPTSGTGSAVISYTAGANPSSSSRTGSVSIAGLSFSITQAGAGGTSGLAFYPVSPCRVADTRAGQGFTGQFGPPSMTAGQTRSFAIPSTGCNIPATAQAYSLNVTVVPTVTLGYLTAWPTGQTQPYVSTLNSSNGAIIANAAIVPAGTGGSISIYVSDATNVILDVNGYFAAPSGSTALAFYPVTPCRVADTRNPNGPFGGPSLAAGATRNFTVPQSACGIPVTAQAYSLNMTVVPPGALEYLSAWPTGQSQPVVSTLNALQGQIAANAAIVPAGTNGAISVYVSDPSNVIIDINGYFGPPGGTGALYFYPVTPCRIADTRNATGTFGGPLLGAGAARSFPIPSSSCGLPSAAQAYAFNMTVVPPGSLLYLSTWPAGQTQPVVSTLNDLQGQIIADAAIVPAGTSGGISVYVSDATNLIIDINGYFGQ